MWAWRRLVRGRAAIAGAGAAGGEGGWIAGADWGGMGGGGGGDRGGGRRGEGGGLDRRHRWGVDGHGGFGGLLFLAGGEDVLQCVMAAMLAPDSKADKMSAPRAFRTAMIREGRM